MKLLMICLCAMAMAKLHYVDVSIAQVLDGYSKQFKAVLNELTLEHHVNLWLCPSDKRLLYSVLDIPKNSKYFLPINWNGYGMTLDYQAFSDVNVNQNDNGQTVLLLSAKREVSKGTTVSITFLEEDNQESVDAYVTMIENGVNDQETIAPQMVIEKSLPHDRELLAFCASRRQEEQDL